MTIVAKHSNPLSYSVTWQCHGRKGQGQTHTVIYGHSEHTFSCDLAASREFGECVRHAAECAGIFDQENS
jgi:hypothetical protein